MFHMDALIDVEKVTVVQRKLCPNLLIVSVKGVSFIFFMRTFSDSLTLICFGFKIKLLIIIRVSNDLTLFLSVMMSHRSMLPVVLDQTATLPKRGALCLSSLHRCGTVLHFQHVLLNTRDLKCYYVMADLPVSPLPIMHFSRALRDTSRTLRPFLMLPLQMFNLMLLELRHIFNDMSYELLL